MFIQITEQVKLINFLQESLIEQYQMTPCAARDIAEYAVKSVFVVIGGSAGFPILNATRKYAGDNTTLANLYTYGFIVSLGALNIWGLFDFLKYVEINHRINNEKSLYKKIAKTIASIALAVITASMGTFINYWYNHSYLLTAQGFICDSVLLSCTYQRMLNSSKLFVKQNHYEKLCAESIDLILISIDSGIKHLASLNNEAQQQFFLRLTNINRRNSLEIDSNFQHDHLRQCIHQLIQFSIPYMIQREKYYFWHSGAPKFLIQYVISSLMPLLWAGISLLASASGAINILHHKVVSYFLVSPGVILSYLLEMILAKEILTIMYNLSLFLLTKSYQKTIPLLYIPSYHLITSAWGLFTAGFSFSTRAQVVKDFIPSFLNVYLIPFVIAFTIILKSSAMQSLVYDLIHYLIRKFASDNIKDLAKLTYAFDKLELAVALASREQIESFITDLDIDQLLQHTDADTQVHKKLTQLQLYQRNQMSNLETEIQPSPKNIFSRCIGSTLFCYRNNHAAMETTNDSLSDQVMHLVEEKPSVGNSEDKSFHEKAFCLVM